MHRDDPQSDRKERRAALELSLDRANAYFASLNAKHRAVALMTGDRRYRTLQGVEDEIDKATRHRDKCDRDLQNHKALLEEDKHRLNTLTKSNHAQNIKRLRLECGWSLNELAHKTGLDKKLIIGHEKGKGIQPKTLKTYPDAFTRGLTRKVLVSELES